MDEDCLRRSRPRYQIQAVVVPKKWMEDEGQYSSQRSLDYFHFRCSGQLDYEKCIHGARYRAPVPK